MQKAINSLPLLKKSFYQGQDVVSIGKKLLGKALYTHIEGKLTGGIIVETESYQGATDKACHAYNFRRTQRTEVMYEAGGVAYIYLCYGIHQLLNVVTNTSGVPEAVLIRAIEPTIGIETMLKRRKKEKLARNLTAGPGALTQALAITKKMNGSSLLGPQIWIEEGKEVHEKEIIASPRVGIDYAEEHAKLPLRFRIQSNPWTSLAK